MMSVSLVRTCRDGVVLVCWQFRWWRRCVVDGVMVMVTVARSLTVVPSVARSERVGARNWWSVCR